MARHAPRPAARLGGKGNRHLAAQHLFIRCLHVLRGPRFQDRILRVHDRGPEVPTCKTTAILTLAVIGIVGIGLHRPVSRTRRRVELKIPEVRVPAEISGTKLGNGILYGRGHGKRRNKGDRKKAGDNTACQQAAPQCRYQNVCCKRRHRRFLHITRNPSPEFTNGQHLTKYLTLIPKSRESLPPCPAELRPSSPFRFRFQWCL